MKYICNQIKLNKCDVLKCHHATPHEKYKYFKKNLFPTDCTIPDECYQNYEEIKVKCIEYHE